MSPRVISALAVLFLSQLFAGLAPVGAALSARPESEVKAAFLYHAPKFVQWPEEALGPETEILEICILGRHSFDTALEGIQGKAVKNRKIDVRYLDSLQTGVESCHVLFVGRSEAAHLETTLAQVKDLPVLTVSEITSFEEKGGMINVFIRDRRIHFRINHDVALSAGLRLSAQLLELAENTPSKGATAGRED